MNHRAHCRSHRKKQIMILLAVVLAVIACLLLTAASIMSFSEKDETKPADTVIVLGASVYDNSPSPVFCERINHAISLYDDGYADTIIMTGGVGEGNIRSEADIAREYAEQKGVPAEAIYMEENSRTTEENLENAEHLMDKHGWDTALIVSDPIHMKRAMMYARDQGMKAYSSPTPTSLYRGWKTKLPFLIREEFYYIGYRLVRPFKSGDNSKSEDKPYGVFLSVTEDLSQFKDYGTVVIDAQYFTDYIERYAAEGADIYLLEYTTNEPLIETIENYCQENGFEYYISDSIELD